jgi:hypothetical protein
VRSAVAVSARMAPANVQADNWEAILGKVEQEKGRTR